MPRPDFENLLDLLRNKSLSSEFSYGFLDDPNYIYPYLKIFYKNSVVVEHKLEPIFTQTPIWIDIFPIDGIPKNKIKAKLYFSLSILVRNLLYTAIVKPTELVGLKKIFTVIAKPFTKFIGPQRFAKLLNLLGKKTDFDSSEKIGNLVWAEGTFEAMKRELILPQTKLNFENKTFPAPLNYHEHLETLYGDYMKLPPTEEQKSHLSEEIYLLEG
jgi:lipopolysaccharide cholinephosphotransferase